MRRILLVDRTSPHAFDGRGQTYRRLLQQSHLPHRQAPLLHVPLRSARRTRSWARRGSLSRSEHPQRLRSSAPWLPLSLPVSSAPALSPSPSSVLVFVRAYAPLWVNYAIFVVPLTAYVVSLLALFGIPEPFVIHHRILNTLLGGLISLMLDLIFFGWERIRLSRQQPDAEPQAS